MLIYSRRQFRAKRKHFQCENCRVAEFGYLPRPACHRCCFAFLPLVTSNLTLTFGERCAEILPPIPVPLSVKFCPKTTKNLARMHAYIHDDCYQIGRKAATLARILSRQWGQFSSSPPKAKKCGRKKGPISETFVRFCFKKIFLSSYFCRHLPSVLSIFLPIRSNAI